MPPPYYIPPPLGWEAQRGGGGIIKRGIICVGRELVRMMPVVIPGVHGGLPLPPHPPHLTSGPPPGYLAPVIVTRGSSYLGNPRMTQKHLNAKKGLADD